MEPAATVRLGSPPTSCTLSRDRKASSACEADRDEITSNRNTVFTSEMSYTPQLRDPTYLRTTTAAASVEPFLGIPGPVPEDELLAQISREAIVVEFDDASLCVVVLISNIHANHTR